MQLDSASVENLVEQITKQVLVLLREEELRALHDGEGSCDDCIGECVLQCKDKVKQVVEAGASRLSSTLGSVDVGPEIANYIDHTLLKADATQDQIAQLCYEARKYGFAAVCVNPTNVKLCTQLLQGSPVHVCTVVGFPLGATPPEVKAYETQQSLDDGATEVDMVINVGALKSGDYGLVERHQKHREHETRRGEHGPPRTAARNALTRTRACRHSTFPSARSSGVFCGSASRRCGSFLSETSSPWPRLAESAA